jgi:hypothetical protein
MTRSPEPRLRNTERAPKVRDPLSPRQRLGNFKSNPECGLKGRDTREGIKIKSKSRVKKPPISFNSH